MWFRWYIPFDNKINGFRFSHIISGKTVYIIRKLKIKLWKKIFFAITITILTFISCTQNDNSDATSPLIGTWKLKEILADPGDGSGIFNTVITNKQLTFYNNGTITSNGSICDMSVEANISTNGTYNETDSTINSTNCNNSTIKYELNGNTLILNYPCFEACKAKYVKE